LDNLEINMSKRNDEICVTCKGRLDANRAGYLNDYIDRLVREGHYHISLDLSGIEYLSSAGIRTLVSQYKNLKAVNGYLSVPQMSGNVKQVLDLVGISDMLGTEQKSVPGKEEEESGLNRLKAYGFVFTRTTISETGKTEAEFYGHPEKIMKADYREKDARVVKSGPGHFAIGLGAIGNSFDECKNRFGEYLLAGKNVAYLPADGSKKPDYMVATGQLVVVLTELYGLHFTGNFTYLISFDPENPKQQIELSRLAETLLQMTDYDRMAFVMIAESGGLIGTSLNVSPVDGKKIFSFPEIKETVNFTTEPAHLKKLTLSAGYISNTPNEDETRFLRPLRTDKKITGHIHSAVFPYIPLKKTDINLNETVEFIFNNTEIEDILHLTNDTREITGQGESQFVKGFCWVVPVEKVNSLTGNE